MQPILRYHQHTKFKTNSYLDGVKFVELRNDVFLKYIYMPKENCVL